MNNFKKHLLVALLACFSLCVKGQNFKKPNLLYIITDEHNFRTIGAYRELLSKEQAFMWGNMVVETPNLDYLAHHGAILTSMYAASPSCTPSRAAMFTGCYPNTVNMPKNGHVLSHHIPTLADVLATNGYCTGYTGKLHLIGNPKPNWNPTYGYGFQHKKYMFNGGHWKKIVFDEEGNPKVGSTNSKGKPNTKLNGADEKTFATDWLTDRAIEFFDAQKSNKQPFFQVVSYPDPHTNNTVRAPYDTLYNIKNVKLPKTFNLEYHKDLPAWKNPELDFAVDKNTKEKKLKKEYTPEKTIRKLKKDITQYFGMVKCIDDNIGKMIQALKKNGQLNNTIIIFTSDHGDLLGEYGRDNKGVPQEGSAKIPFIVYYPKAIKAGTVINKAANNTDFMDTALSLMGITNFDPNTTEGRDISDWLLEKENKNLKDITFVTYQWWTAVITDRYKLVLDKSQTKPWLIDLDKDPTEMMNFIEDKTYRSVVVQLVNELLAYGKKHKDPVVLDKRIQSQLSLLLK